MNLEESIRKHRMAQVEVTILNADRIPCPGREVLVKQTGHKFLFGTGGFELALANGELAGEEKEQAESRLGKMTALCNYATLPFYWGRFEPERGKPHTRRLMNTARLYAERGLLAKGHPLCWHTVTADWLLDLPNDEIIQAQKHRIGREVNDFRGLVDIWDVVNEAVIMPVFDKYDNGITRICKEMGRVKLIKTMFDVARGVNPGATLLLNDFNLSPAYAKLIEDCLEAGVRIDAIGLQTHMHQGYMGVDKTLAVVERFARFKVPLHFTETSLVSGHLMPPEIEDLNDYRVTEEEWPTTPAGEDRQAEEAVLHYKTLFGHPAVAGVTWWDLSDGHWLHAPAGLLRRDGSAKPAYEELLKLVKGEWWLAPTSFMTDAVGRLRFTGCPGDYELEYGGRRMGFKVEGPGEARVEVKV